MAPTTGDSGSSSPTSVSRRPRSPWTSWIGFPRIAIVPALNPMASAAPAERINKLRFYPLALSPLYLPEKCASLPLFLTHFGIVMGEREGGKHSNTPRTPKTNENPEVWSGASWQEAPTLFRQDHVSRTNSIICVHPRHLRIRPPARLPCARSVPR